MSAVPQSGNNFLKTIAVLLPLGILGIVATLGLMMDSTKQAAQQVAEVAVVAEAAEVAAEVPNTWPGLQTLSEEGAVTLSAALSAVNQANWVCWRSYRNPALKLDLYTFAAWPGIYVGGLGYRDGPPIVWWSGPPIIWQGFIVAMELQLTAAAGECPGWVGQ